MKRKRAEVDWWWCCWYNLVQSFDNCFCAADRHVFFMLTNIISGSFIRSSEDERTENVTQQIPS